MEVKDFFEKPVVTRQLVNSPTSMPCKSARIVIASFRLFPQTSCSALKPAQTDGRSGEWNMAHPYLSVRWIHLTPAGLPFGIPGIGEEIEGTMQQAPQLERHSIHYFFAKN